MLGTSTRRMTRGKARSEAERKAEDKRKKREAKLFKIRKVIGPSDLPVDRKLGKVKVEEPENEVKPEVGEEPEVKVRTVTEEIDLDVEEGPAEDVLVLPANGDQTGSLAGLETNKDEVEEGTKSGGETMAELRREIESLRKQLSAATSNQTQGTSSSSGVELLKSRIAELIAENEAQRQKIGTLNELIVEHTLEIRRLRKKCNEARVAPVSLGESSTTVETRVGRQVGDEMRRRVEDMMLGSQQSASRTGSGKTGSASDDDLGQENCSAEENLEDQRLEIEEPRQQLNEASSGSGQQNGRNCSEDSGEMNMAQELGTISGQGGNKSLEIRNLRRILRPRPNTQSLGKHHKQLHDDEDKSKSYQHIRQQVAKTGETKRPNNVPKNRKVDKKPAQVQRASYPNETPAYKKQRFTSIPKPLKCPRPGCLFRFNQKFYLKRHIFLHDNPFAFQCQICKKLYQSKEILQFHKNVMHNPNNPKPKPFTCPQCPAKYCRKNELKRHLKFHENPDAFRCDICKNHYATQFTLRHHQIRYHSDK